MTKDFQVVEIKIRNPQRLLGICDHLEAPHEISWPGTTVGHDREPIELDCNFKGPALEELRALFSGCGNRAVLRVQGEFNHMFTTASMLAGVRGFDVHAVGTRENPPTLSLDDARNRTFVWTADHRDALEDNKFKVRDAVKKHAGEFWKKHGARAQGAAPENNGAEQTVDRTEPSGVIASMLSSFRQRSTKDDAKEISAEEKDPSSPENR